MSDYSKVESQCCNHGIDTPRRSLKWYQYQEDEVHHSIVCPSVEQERERAINLGEAYSRKAVDLAWFRNCKGRPYMEGKQ